jgi:alpha-tubulin suppressor-like RCC1 family protein
MREDLGRKVNDYENLNQNHHYTYIPQPIVSLLGTKLRNVEAGRQHILALASCGSLYAWGDNSYS